MTITRTSSRLTLICGVSAAELRASYAVPAEDPVPHTPFEAPPGLRRPVENRAHPGR